MISLHCPWLTCLLASVLLTGGMFMVDRCAAAEKVAVTQRAVEMVRLVDGKQLLGMFAQPPAEKTSGEEQLTLYVARDWLRKRQPAFYRQFAAGEEKRHLAALEQCRERLLAWLQRRAEPKLLHDFIQRSLRDVEKQLQNPKADAAAEASQLLIVSLPAKQVKRWYVRPQTARRLLALAWEARVPDAEELSAERLSEQLKQRGVDVENGESDLSDRFGIVPFTPTQWAAKVALIEFEILGKPRFQGTGGTLIDADDSNRRVPLANLVGDLLQDQLGDALGDLLNPATGENQTSAKSKRQAAVQKALGSAAAKKATGARITYLEQSLSQHRVTVTDTFYALMPDGAWQAVWRQAATINSDAEQAPNAEALAADPQVAEIMRVLKGLGLDANQDLLRSALRFGAATQKAMDMTEREFGSFLRRHTRRLMGPPIVLQQPDAQP